MSAAEHSDCGLEQQGAGGRGGGGRYEARWPNDKKLTDVAEAVPSTGSITYTESGYRYRSFCSTWHSASVSTVF